MTTKNDKEELPNIDQYRQNISRARGLIPRRHLYYVAMFCKPYLLPEARGRDGGRGGGQSSRD